MGSSFSSPASGPTGPTGVSHFDVESDDDLVHDFKYYTSGLHRSSIWFMPQDREVMYISSSLLSGTSEYIMRNLYSTHPG